MPRKAPHSVALRDGRRVYFILLPRTGEPYLFVRFYGPEGRRLEKSTRATSQSAALQRATEIITGVCTPEEGQQRLMPWDEVNGLLLRALQANGNKPLTVTDYQATIRVYRTFDQKSVGPGDVTPARASAFKLWYADGNSAQSVKSRLNKLRCLWSRWLVAELKLLSANPWGQVPLPKVNRPEIRLLSPEEIGQFLAWMDGRFDGWRLPRLFWVVKGLIGCRLGEFCRLRSEQLVEGRIVFPPDETKGRKARKALVPEKVYAELKAAAGPTWLWEGYSEGLRKFQPKGRENCVKPFAPKALYSWADRVIDQYRAAFPGRPTFSAHDFRRKAMTDAWECGVGLDEAAVAFGTNAGTMRQFYVRMNESRIADEVMRKVAERQGQV